LAPLDGRILDVSFERRGSSFAAQMDFHAQSSRQALQSERMKEPSSVDRERQSEPLTESPQHVGLGFWDVESSGASIRLTQELRQMLGLGPDEGVSDVQSYAERVHAADRERVIREFADLLEHGKAFDSQYRLKRADGQWLTVHAWGGAQIGLDGRVQKAFGAVKDVTLLQQTQEKQRRERDFSSALLAATEEAFAFSRDGAIVELNAELCRLTGFSRAELLGTSPPFPFWPRENEAQLLTASQQAHEESGGDFEVLLMRKGGGRFEAAVSVRPVRGPGQIVLGQLTLVRDISKQKQQERALTTGNMRLAQIIAVQREIMECGPDFSKVMQLTAERARLFTSAGAAAIELREGDEMVYRGVSGSAASALGLRLSVFSSLSGRCIIENESFSCEDTEADTRVDREACRRLNVRSMLLVPLRHEDQTVGVLKVMSPVPQAFHTEHIGTLELLAGFVGSAMAHAATNRALQSSEQKFRALAELASDAIVTIDHTGQIAFWNQSASRTFGYSAEEMLGEPLTRLMPDRYTAAHVAALGAFDPTRTSSVVNKTIELEGRRSDGREFPLELSVSTWNSGTKRFYTGIIRDISERKQLEAAVLELARTDHVTGLFTRRAGEEAIAREVARAARYQRPLSFALLDLDHFKRVNDAFGHAAGDLVLQCLGKLLLTRLRKADIVVRWGGEEILLVLPETAIEGASSLVEAIRSQISDTPVDGVGQVTASIGLVELLPNETAALAIARADAKLYLAKTAGRNRVAR
jgi:two-component system cell cycle response regulator